MKKLYLFTLLFVITLAGCTEAKVEDTDSKPIETKSVVSGETAEPKATVAPTAKPEPKNKETITKAEFELLKTGMTYDEVSKIIGGPGELLSESGTKGGTDLDIHITMYMYTGEGSLGANANAMFQDEKLINKAQMGLK
jgi:hypothetical protein